MTLLTTGVVLLGTLSLVSPQRGVIALMVVGVVVPYYLGSSIDWLPNGINGPLVMALLMACCAVGMAVRYGPRFDNAIYVAPAAALLCVWLLAPLGMTEPPAGATGAGLVYSMSGVEFVIALATLAVGGTRRGRDALLCAWAWAGVVAAVLAIIEFALRRNLILEFALHYDVGEKWTEVPTRFGLTRISGAFGHPILLGCFLGAAMLATLEAARRRVVSERLAVALVSLMLVGQLSTLSRGPIVATIAVLAAWALLAWPMRTWRRAALIAVVVACVAVTGLQVAVEGSVAALLRPSTSELGETSMHRVNLMRAFFAELVDPTAFGSDPESVGALQQFGGTIDHEGLFVLVTRGAVGLGALAALVCVPVLVVLFRERGRWLGKLFPLLVPAYLVLIGSTVAFFGQWLTFVFVLIPLTWSVLADSKREVGEVSATVIAPVARRAGDGLPGSRPRAYHQDSVPRVS